MSASYQIAAMGPQTGPAVFIKQLNYPSAVNVTYPVTSADYGIALNITGAATPTVLLPPATALPTGFWFAVWNTSTSDIAVAIRVIRNTDTIDGIASTSFPSLRRGEGLVLTSDGLNWQTSDKKAMRGYAENLTASNRAVAAGSNAVAIGASTASGSGSFAAAGGTSSGANAVAIGSSAQSVAQGSVAIGSSAICNDSNQIAIGTSASTGSFAFYAAAFHGIAQGEYSYAFGRYASTSQNKGKFAFSSFNSGTAGNNQAGLTILLATTTGTGTAQLKTNSSATSGDNQIGIANASAVAFSALIVAKQATTSTNSAAWKIEGLIVRDNSTITLVNSSIVVINNAPGWADPVASADVSNLSLRITVTAPSSITVTWLATVNTSEVVV